MTTITDGTDVSTVLRTNLAVDPRATAVGVLWGYQLGAGEVAATTLVAGASDGPLLPDGTRIPTYVRRTITTAKTGSSSGPWFRTPVGAVPLEAGQTFAGSMHIRVSVAVTLSLSVSNRSGGTGGTSSTQTVNLAANTWTRIGRDDTAEVPGDNTQVWAVLAAGTILPAGTTVDTTGGQVEYGSVVTPYFDGSLQPDPPLSYAYLGAANASPSVEVQTLPRQTTPDLVLTMEYSAEVRNIFHATLDRSDPDMTKRPTATRAGTLELFYSDLAAAQDAYAMLRDATTLTLTNDVDPWKSMTFAPSSRLALRREGESARWVVTVGYTEVAP